MGGGLVKRDEALEDGALCRYTPRLARLGSSDG